MKRFIIFLTAVFAFADISGVINKIKQMESYKPVFIKMPVYNVFTDVSTKKEDSNFIKLEVKKVILKLNAIFQNKANINGVWVKKGDIIEGYEVVEVKNDSVVLKKEGEIKILQIKPNILKVVK